jgi:hypothetical protein
MTATMKASKIVHRECFNFRLGYAALNARIKELEATGKYTKVTSRRPGYGPTFSILCYAEVVTEVQERGTCQVCGGQQAVKLPHLALHGYKRPRWGYLVGRCYGTDHAPAERSVVITEGIIDNLKHDELRIRAQMEAEGWTDTSGTQRPHYPPTPDAFYQWSEDERLAYTRATHALYHALRNAEDYRQHLSENVLPRFGLPLARVAKR